ncbi:MAG TPA: NAD-dependent epimerase/dehydratase family protein [Solirubrobacteraceae bacterium]|nr:NAD-dependent epimerase/dehydratase family protein [Solirubrobacteraceae bacterium]
MSGARGACLLTGASGFIGGRLAARLAGAGGRVRCLVRAASATAALETLGVEVFVGDLTDPASLARAAEGCESAVHCAALVSDWATVAEIRAANVAGTRNLLAAARDAGLLRLVHISTTDVYGHPGVEVDESYASRRFRNWYAQTKLEAEEEVRAAALETVIVRPATVYGPGSREVIGAIARAIRARQMLLIDRGRANAGLVYVENLADLVLLALERDAAAGEAFNATDGLDVTWARFTADLAAGLGCPAPRLSLPFGPARALGRGLEHGYRGLRRVTGLRAPPLLSRQAVDVLGADQAFSNARARAVLGWKPRVGYGDGLAATLAWLREDFLSR